MNFKEVSSGNENLMNDLTDPVYVLHGSGIAKNGGIKDQEETFISSSTIDLTPGQVQAKNKFTVSFFIVSYHMTICMNVKNYLERISLQQFNSILAIFIILNFFYILCD